MECLGSYRKTFKAKNPFKVVRWMLGKKATQGLALCRKSKDKQRVVIAQPSISSVKQPLKAGWYLVVTFRLLTTDIFPHMYINLIHHKYIGARLPVR